MDYLLLKGEGMGLNPEGEDSINQGLCQINYGGYHILLQIYEKMAYVSLALSKASDDLEGHLLQAQGVTYPPYLILHISALVSAFRD